MKLSQHSKELLRFLVRTLNHRGELVGIELAEVRERALAMLALAVVALVLLLMALFGLSLVVLLLFWDGPHRITAIGVLSAVYTVLALLCLFKIRALTKQPVMPESRRVLQDDVAWLQNQETQQAQQTQQNQEAKHDQGGEA